MKTDFIKYIASVCMILMTASCSEIGENERFIEVQIPDLSTPSQRHVLIEDFTGQSCVNCPEASKLIHSLQERYGSDVVVAAGIYSGPFGNPKGSSSVSLVTQLGETYWDHWFTSTTSQPIGIINRRVIADKEDWTKAVIEALAESTKMKIQVQESLFDETNRQYILTIQVTDPNHTEGHLQVWLIENGFVGSQMTPNATRPNKEYVHNHILRASMNGDWGEMVDLGTEGSSRTYSRILDESWNADNMEVIIFVYTEEGVEQVIKHKVTTKM